jgi:F-type H+-transporting ATPase subunit a
VATSPLHQFEILPLVPIHIGNLDLSFTNSSLMMAAAVGVTALLFGSAMSRRALVPGRLQSVAELLYEFVAGMVRDNIGPQGWRYFPFVFTIFTIILLGNLIGMVPYAFTFTSHIIVTGALAIIAFMTATVVGFMRHGLHYFSLFVPHGAPMWLMPIIVPIEVLSYLTRPVSLSIRLFANMMAGHTMLKVFAGFSVLLGAFGVFPLLINIALVGFEVLVALLQAYVFAILTCLYLRDAVELH